MSEHHNEAESFATKFGFGKAEEMMGQDMYQSQVEHTKAHVQETQATVKYAEARARLLNTWANALAAITFPGMVLGVLMGIAVTIRLFRWAFGF